MRDAQLRSVSLATLPAAIEALRDLAEGTLLYAGAWESVGIAVGMPLLLAQFRRARIARHRLHGLRTRPGEPHAVRRSLGGASLQTQPPAKCGAFKICPKHCYMYYIGIYWSQIVNYPASPRG